MLSVAKIYLLVFAVLTLVGGVMGYVKVGSTASLVAGAVSGVLLMASAFLIPGKALIGLIMGFVVSVALAGRFVPVFMAGGGFMPAGLMSALSVVSILITILAFFKR